MNKQGVLVLVLLGAAACSRPVGGRQVGATIVDTITVEPRFVREGVPVTIDVRVTGAAPTTIGYAIAGISRACAPERVAEGRYRCVEPGLDRGTFPQGSALVVVEVTDANGRTTIATAPITVDFDCPSVVGLRVTGGARQVADGRGDPLFVAEPGSAVSLAIEASEPLARAPVISRGGRPWVAPAGAERTWASSQPLTSMDPSAPTAVVVRVTDLAGNSSGDLCPDGRLVLAVDHAEPLVDAARIEVLRGAPGVASTLAAQPGAFADDVGIREVRVFDGRTAAIAVLSPASDGSIARTNLQTQTTTRVTVQVVDFLGRTSPAVRVRERWQLSIGSGSLPGAAIRTGVRLTPGAAEATSMENRTAELAADVVAADGRAATVRAEVGFTRVGTLPNSFESRFGIAAGYDAVGDATVLFGGAYIIEPGVFDYGDRTVILRWNERQHAYVAEAGPTPAYGVTPHARFSTNIAFDDRGCGVLFGGDGVIRRPDGSVVFGYLDDVWQVCRTPEGYRWQEITPAGEPPIYRIAPVVFDPLNQRYVVPCGESQAFRIPFGDVFVLQPGATPDAWRWDELMPLPASFNLRRGHLAFWDPRVNGLATGLGLVQPVGSGEERLFWTYRTGQWSAVNIPTALRYWEDFGADYDRARGQLVMWGGGSFGAEFPETNDVWFMAGSSTVGASAWRSVDLEAPLARWRPTVVYDRAREQTLVFGGYRDDRFVPTDVHALTAEPSWPYFETTIALGAARPSGIEDITIDLVADGVGDADGVGGARVEAAGVDALIWDYSRRAWAPLAYWPGGARRVVLDASAGTPLDAYLSEDGRVTIKLRSHAPATEGAPARLVVDRVDGVLNLGGRP